MEVDVDVDPSKPTPPKTTTPTNLLVHLPEALLSLGTIAGMSLSSPLPAAGLGVAAYGLLRLDRWLRPSPVARPTDDDEYKDLSDDSHLFPVPIHFPEPATETTLTPAELRALAEGDNDAIDQRLAYQRTLHGDLLGGAIITRNPEFRARIEDWLRAGLESSRPMLVTGPTGVGKTAIVRALNRLVTDAGRTRGQLVMTNGAMFTDQFGLVDMFGHAKGAYTGAEGERRGLMMEADGGLLFIDELGEIPMGEQAKLLIAIETGRFRPVGSTQELVSRFRLVGATNRDLYRMVEQGQFREDLRARVSTFTLEMMPLAERPEDVEPNLDIELALHSRRRGVLCALTPEARVRFLTVGTSAEATWPDNFRGLADAVEHLVTYAPNKSAIDVATVERVIAQLRKHWARGRRDVLIGLVSPAILAQMTPLDRYVLAYLVRVCRREGTLTKAGRALFVVNGVEHGTEGTRLRKHLARFGLTFPMVVGAEAD